MNNVPIAQLENSQDISVDFTVHESPIWRAKLWITHYTKHLSFMADEDTRYNRSSVSISSIIIDFVEYLKVNDYGVLRDTKKSWMFDPQDNSRLFVHFDDHNPPFWFSSFKNGRLYAFSYGLIKSGGVSAYPVLIDLPMVEDAADHLSYKRMEFASGSVIIDNSTGMLDDLRELFGNNLNLLLYNAKTAELEMCRQFFIESYTIGLKDAKFSVKDKRSRLTFKAPNTFYTKEEYPHIDEKFIGKIIQDAYGYCRGVAGACVNEKEIYENEADLIFNDWFRFKFARKITSIKEVLVEMSDVWTEVFPGLGIKGNDAPDNPNPNTGWSDINPYPIRIMAKDPVTGEYTIPVDVTTANMKNLPDNDGQIEIWWSQALKDNTGLERRGGKPNKVKMNGVFVDKHSPGDIIKDLMVYYGELPYEASYFNLDEWEKEMGHARPIGICLEKDDDIYSWIEKIQNGSMIGFQLLVHKNLFSARLDNPNRKETFDIHWSEIANKDEIEPELNGENYATFTTINYNKEYTDDQYLTIVDQSKRTDILEIYKFEKEYANDSYLIYESDVIQKGNIILENFMWVHPIFRNIELDGLRWESIQLYSTGFIDFTAELPRQMKIVQKYMKNREFMGRMRVKVIGCRRDLKLEKTFIDVIQCDYNLSMPLHLLPPGRLDITGGNPSTQNQQYNLNGGRPAENTEIIYILDGGGVVL